MLNWQVSSKAYFGVIAVFGLSFPLQRFLLRGIHAMRGGERAVQLQSIRAFVERHPGWIARIYETPAGFRVIAGHRLFDPLDPQVTEAFRAWHTDLMYQDMCQRQRCFRARLTAKPWRIGIEAHLKPRPGVWPVHPDRLEMRQRWTAAYDERCRQYAACRFLQQIGAGRIDPAVQDVIDLHDELSGAISGRPIA